MLAVGSIALIAALVGAIWSSYRTSQREAAIFATLSETAFAQGFCDRALRLAIAGLPPTEGASPLSYRSPLLQGDLSFFGSGRNCFFRLALAGHTALVDTAVFSAHGSRVVTASWDNTARVWDAVTGATVATLSGHSGWVTSAAFSPDGSKIVTASWDKTARVWDAKTGANVATLSGHTDRVNSASFSPDGLRVVTASDDDTARVWDVKSGGLLVTLSGDTDSVNSAVFSPDGSRLVTASFDGTARVWDADTGSQLATLSGHKALVWGARFSPDGSRIVTASDDKTAQVWDAKSGSVVATLTGHTGPVLEAVFSPDGSRIVTASLDNTARVWDAQTGALLITLSGHAGWVWTAALSSDGSVSSPHPRTRPRACGMPRRVRLSRSFEGIPVRYLRQRSASTDLTSSPRHSTTPRVSGISGKALRYSHCRRITARSIAPCSVRTVPVWLRHPKTSLRDSGTLTQVTWS
jgi:Tol biopolymer transport system component